VQKALAERAPPLKRAAEGKDTALLQPYSLALGPRQAGVIAGTGHDVIYNAIRHKKLMARKLGRRTVILRDDLEEWLKSLPPLELREDTAHRRRAEGRNKTAAPNRRRECAEQAQRQHVQG